MVASKLPPHRIATWHPGVDRVKSAKLLQMIAKPASRRPLSPRLCAITLPSSSNRVQDGHPPRLTFAERKRDPSFTSLSCVTKAFCFRTLIQLVARRVGHDR